MARILHRIGRACGRHRVLVLVLWIAAVVAFGAGAAHSEFSKEEFSVPGSESSRALDRLNRDFPALASSGGRGTGSLQLVLTAPPGRPITSVDTMVLARTVVKAAARIPHVAAASDPFDAKNPFVSQDLTTAVSTLTITGLTDDNASRIHDDVLALAAGARAQGLGAEVGGSLGAAKEAAGSATEAIGVALAFLVLLVTFGSLVAAGANMLGALVGVAAGSLGVFAFSAFHPLDNTTPTLAVMLGLAVGIDYCLFILARFRAELRAGRSVDEAIGHAVGTAGSAVVFAGATVVVALAGLSITGIGFITEMGLAAAFAVTTSVLMAITLVPVLLRTMGHRVLPRRERHAALSGGPGGEAPGPGRSPGCLDGFSGGPGGEAPGPGRSPGCHSAAPRRAQAVRLTFLERWIRTVVRRPVLVGGLAIAGLLVLSAPVLSMNTALATPGGDDPHSTERAAYDRIAEKFGAGAQSPLLVLVEGSGAGARLPAVAGSISRIDGVAAAAPGGVTATGDAAFVQVIPVDGPADPGTKDLVRRIRDTLHGDGVTVSVTGKTAITIDTDAALRRALVVYLLVVVGLSLLLLMVLFRSVLVPLMATLGFLLSLGSALGVTVAVFQWGWWGAVFAAPTGNPILTLLPILIAGILFGLAMDYQVFLVSRIHESHRHGLDPIEAVLDGFGRAAVVVAAAAVIMTSVFTGFAVVPAPIVASLGLALAAGVLADAFVVRMVVTPALLALLGDKAWWIPRWLDRVLPHVDAEGSALEPARPDSVLVDID